MWKYMVRRSLLAIPVLFVVSVISFFMILLDLIIVSTVASSEIKSFLLDSNKNLVKLNSQDNNNKKIEITLYNKFKNFNPPELYLV